jgi:hypothetical protein
LQPLAQDYFDHLRARAIVFPRFGVNAFDNLGRKPYRDRLPPAAQFGRSLGDVRGQIGQRCRGFLDSLGDLADRGDAGAHVATGGLPLRSNTRLSPSTTMLCCDRRPVNASSRSWSYASSGSRTVAVTVRVAARAGGVAVSAAAVTFLAIATSRLVDFLVRTSSGDPWKETGCRAARVKRGAVGANPALWVPVNGATTAPGAERLARGLLQFRDRRSHRTSTVAADRSLPAVRFLGWWGVPYGTRVLLFTGHPGSMSLLESQGIRHLRNPFPISEIIAWIAGLPPPQDTTQGRAKP